jgi:subtilisin family serine protease
LFATSNFCRETVLVVLEPEISHFNESVDDSFWGTLEKKSVENIFRIANPFAIDALQERELNTDYKFRSIYKITLQENNTENVLNVIHYLNSIKGVESASPNYYTTLGNVTPNDPLWNHPGLWNLKDGHGINATAAWNITTGSRNVRVGIIDSGIGNLGNPHPETGIPSHPDLHANLQPGMWFNSNSWNTSDTDPHGTMSAGIVGAVGNNGIGVVGVNWAVSMIPLKVSGSINSAISAIEWAINKWGTDEQIDILTMSMLDNILGEDTLLNEAINSFLGLFFRAAGNAEDNIDDRPFSSEILNITNMVVVGAIDMDGTRRNSSNYSSSNQYVQVFAPGENGYTTSVRGSGEEVGPSPTDRNLYRYYNDTSIATPHVAGVAALMLSVNPTLTAVELKSIIENSSDKININIPVAPNQIEVNKLNAFNAVRNTVSTDLSNNENHFGQNLNLQKGYSIINNARVSFTNSSFSFNPSSGLLPNFFGLRVFDGILTLNNCSFNSPIHLQAIGPNSTIIIQGGNLENIRSITVKDRGTIIFAGNNVLTLRDNVKIDIDNESILEISVGATLVLQNNVRMNLDSSSKLTIDNNSSLKLINNSRLTLNDKSEFHLNGGDLILSGKSRVTLNSASKWWANQNASIIGHTLGHQENEQNQERGFSMRFPLELITDPEWVEFPGDRIVLNRSWVDFNNITISHGRNGFWDGIYFFNCRPNGDNITTPSRIRARISGIRTIQINNSDVIFE